MITDFLATFSDVLPTWPDADGKDQIESASRLHNVPLVGVTSNVVRIVAPEAVIAAMKASGQFVFWQDYVEEIDAIG